MAPTSRMTAAGLGKMPTTFDRRLISLFRRSSGLVLCNCRLEGRLRQLKDMPLEVRQCIKSIKVRRVNLDPGDGMMDTIYEVTFWDKMKALELLAGHLGLLQQPPDRSFGSRGAVGPRCRSRHR